MGCNRARGRGAVLIPGAQNAQIEKDLENLPDLVSESLLKWRKETLEREKVEALLYLSFKNDGGSKTVREIEALVESDNRRYEARLKESVAESDYERLYERLMSSKKLADLRTAF